MVGHVSVHDNDKIAGGVLDAMNVGCSQAKLALTRSQQLQHHTTGSDTMQETERRKFEAAGEKLAAFLLSAYEFVLSIDCLELFGNFQGAIRASIINDNDFIVQLSVM